MRDVPFALFDHIRMALTFLGWLELPEDERPPRHIWFSQKQLEEHFEAVKKMREEKYGGGGGGVEDAVQNDAAKGLIVG